MAAPTKPAVPSHRFDGGRSCDAKDIDYGEHIARCTACGMRWSLGSAGWVPIGRSAVAPTIRRGLFE